jgi:hypothetical protein
MTDAPRYLYHGTSGKNARLAAFEGIHPRGKHGRTNWKRTVESNPDAVYLTDAYPLYFAINAAKGDDDYAVIQIDTEKLDQLWLVPDEDVFEQAGRGKDDVKGNMKQRTRWYRQRMKNWLATDNWKVSLQAMGTCASLAPIPPEAITRIAYVPHDALQLAMEAGDASIMLANYRFCGPKYRNLTNALFGLPAEADPVGIDEFNFDLLTDEQRESFKGLIESRQRHKELLAADLARVKVEEINV